MIAKKSNPIPESIVEAQVLMYLRSKGFFCWKSVTTGYYNPKLKTFVKQRSPFAINGTTDIMGIYLQSGTMLAIEVKTLATHKYIQKHYERLKIYCGTNKNYHHLRQQIEFIEKINACGGIAFFTSSVEETTRVLENLSR